MTFHHQICLKYVSDDIICFVPFFQSLLLGEGFVWKGRFSLHFVKHHVVQITTCNKYHFAYTNLTMLEASIEIAKPTLQNSKNAFNIFPHTFHVARIAGFVMPICLQPHKWTQQCWPLQIPIIKNQICTSPCWCHHCHWNISIPLFCTIPYQQKDINIFLQYACHSLIQTVVQIHW